MAGLSTRGGEFLVNSSPTGGDSSGNQRSPDAVLLDSGNVAVAWVTGPRTQARLFDPGGQAIFDQFDVRGVPGRLAPTMQEPSLTASGGNSFVAYEYYSFRTSGAIPSTSYGVEGQYIDVVGTTIDGEILATPSGALNLELSTLTSGKIVLAFAGNAEITAWMFDPTDLAGRSVVQVNTVQSGTQDEPEVTSLASGGFVVTWNDNSGLGGDASGYGVKSQVFDANGGKVGSETLVNTAMTGDQVDSAVAAVGTGYVAVWTDLGLGDGSGSSIKAQLFDANGNKVGGEIDVNTTTLGAQREPAVVGLPTGGFAVVWVDASGAGGDSSGTAIRAQLFSASGVKDGAEILVNSTTLGDQTDPTITLTAHGELFVAWVDASATGGDTVGTAIRAQLLVPGDADAFVGTPGDDLYLVDNPADTIAEGSNGGFDTVRSSVSYMLRPGVSVERLEAAASQPISLTGNEQAQALIGNAGNNIVDGRAGNDTLTGGGGIDRLTGGEGFDTFSDTAQGFNGDTITDLAVGEKLVVTGVDAANFTFQLNGSQLSFEGASVTLGGAIAGKLVSAPVNGGVEMTLVNDVRDDFNGDGRSDLIWRDDTGSVQQWQGQADGGFEENDATGFYDVPNDWQVAGTGDFNGDGLSDLLWRNTSGAVLEWRGQANGGFLGNYTSGYYEVPNSWQVTGTGDFNGDGRDEILWRNDDGRLLSWLSQPEGGFRANPSGGNQVPLDWKVVGTGDFNGDRVDDILWGNGTGEFTEWLGRNSGVFIDNPNSTAQLGSAWNAVGIGDFDGNGRDEILWRNDNDVRVGAADGRLTTGAQVGVVGLDWNVARIGDFNGDGRDDIAWHSDAGRFTDWLGQSGGGFVNNGANAEVDVPASWQIQPDYFMV